MTAIHVDTTRVVDRNELLAALAGKGLEAHAIDGDGEDLFGLELECDEEGCGELVHAIDEWLTENQLPFVPQQVDNRIILRPPLG